MGPNVKALIIKKLSLDAVPDGEGFPAALKFLQSSGGMARGWYRARAWVEEAIGAVRGACDPNPWKDKSDEEIAAVILCKIKEQGKSEKTAAVIVGHFEKILGKRDKEKK